MSGIQAGRDPDGSGKDSTTPVKFPNPDIRSPSGNRKNM